MSIFEKYVQKQREYMMCVGQIDEQGNVLKKVNYLNLIYEEFQELLESEKPIDTLDAICDILVCVCGSEIMGQGKFNDKLFYTFIVQIPVDALDEVFANNFARVQKDENGKAVLEPEFLENGTRNPKAFKVVKIKDFPKPNLEQFI